MILFILIGRHSDNLLLSCSWPDETRTAQLSTYSQQANLLLRKVRSDTPRHTSIQTGGGGSTSTLMFHLLFVPEANLVYVALAETNLSKQDVFQFLEEINRQFTASYPSSQIARAARPYHFIEFERVMTRQARLLTPKPTGIRPGGMQGGGGSSSEMDRLNTDLQDVQRIMVRNIDDVLQRGESLSELDQRAGSLSHMSRAYRKDATSLNTRAKCVKCALLALAVLFLLFLVYYLFSGWFW